MTQITVGTFPFTMWSFIHLMLITKSTSLSHGATVEGCYTLLERHSPCALRPLQHMFTHIQSMRGCEVRTGIRRVPKRKNTPSVIQTNLLCSWGQLLAVCISEPKHKNNIEPRIWKLIRHPHPQKKGWRRSVRTLKSNQFQNKPTWIHLGCVCEAVRYGCHEIWGVQCPS